MKPVNLSELNEQELFQEGKKVKSRLTIFRVIIGFMIIASIYGTYYKGFSTSTITFLCFIPLLISIDKKYKAVQIEIQSRQSQ